MVKCFLHARYKYFANILKFNLHNHLHGRGSTSIFTLQMEKWRPRGSFICLKLYSWLIMKPELNSCGSNSTGSWSSNPGWLAQITQVNCLYLLTSSLCLSSPQLISVFAIIPGPSQCFEEVGKTNISFSAS